MSEKLSKDRLIKLVTDIMNADGTESEIDSWLNTFRQSVSHPNTSDLIFYPERLSEAEENQEMTPEEIVNIALDYKAILL